MYRFFFLLTALLFLPSCSLPGTQEEASSVSTENTVLFENEKISLRVPKAWSGRTTDLPIPRIGSLVAAYVSEEVRSGYAPSLVILSDTLMSPMTSERYSELNTLQTKKNYLEYASQREENITFTDSDTSRVFVFDAKYNETTPKMKYIQTARVCGLTVYLIHFTLPIEKKSENYIELMKTFTCK